MRELYGVADGNAEKVCDGAGVRDEEIDCEIVGKTDDVAGSETLSGIVVVAGRVVDGM